MSGRGTTPVNPDFKDLFAALNAAGARFLLVGGYALAHHGHPRFTRHLDVWVEPEPDNSRRVFAALEAFGAPLHELRREDLEREGLIFQIGVPPNRIDIITSIGRSHLIASKRASGRPQDPATDRSGDPGASAP